MDVGSQAMEGFSTLTKVVKQCAVGIILPFIILGCSSKKVMRESEGRFKDINDEYAKVVKVEPSEAVNQTPTTSPEVLTPKPGVKTHVSHSKKVTHDKHHAETPAAAPTNVHLPEIEDSEGFVGRRPIVDPFHEGEKIVLDVNYFNVVAGSLTIEVLPLKVVNGRKVYHFTMAVKSNSMFSMFYAVEDTAETFVDYETLAPVTYSIEAHESARQKQVRAFFDQDKHVATIWEKVIEKDDPQEKKRKVEWDIEPFTQNVISALYYLRTFTLTTGKKLAFRVSDESKNYVFNGEVLRRETLTTAAGELKTVVVQPTFKLGGQFKPTGDIFIWLTDDDRKLPVRVESKIKIGTLVAKLKSLQRGK